MSRTCRVLALELAMALLACVRAAPLPQDTLSALVRAIETDDFAAAYALASSELRNVMTLEEFRRRFQGPAGQELRATLLLAAARVQPEIHVDVGDDTHARLIFEDGAWRLAELPVRGFSQRTPLAALRTFLAALEKERYDVMLRLVPERARASLDAGTLKTFWEGGEGRASRQQLARIREELPIDIPTEGDLAHWPYADGRELRFVREGTVWCIESW